MDNQKWRKRAINVKKWVVLLFIMEHPGIKSDLYLFIFQFFFNVFCMIMNKNYTLQNKCTIQREVSLNREI